MEGSPETAAPLFAREVNAPITMFVSRSESGDG
jgi:hypothetical protein